MTQLADWQAYLILFLAGILAGGINTLAGSGSLITLPLLIFLGLDARIANATNRIGVIAQSTVGAYSFRQLNEFGLRDSLWIIIPSVIGAIYGGFVAANLNEQIMHALIGGLMIFMLVVLILHPERWLRDKTHKNENHKKWWMIAVMLAIGFYGGLLQAGVGIMMLSAFVLLAKQNLKHANALKLFNAFLFTIPPVIIFIVSGLVVWEYAIAMIPGQAIGAYGATQFAMKFKNSNIWVHRLLIVIVVGTIIKFFNLWNLIFG